MTTVLLPIDAQTLAAWMQRHDGDHYAEQDMRTALRDQIIAAKDGKALRDLAPQMRGVQTEVVADADGKPVVLAALLKRRLAELSGVAA